MAPTKTYFRLCFCVFFTVLVITPKVDSSFLSNWLNHGGGLYNRRYAHTEIKINSLTAANLRLKWKFFTGHDVSATPAIFQGVLYFPSWNGYLYAVKAKDGSLVWKKNLQELTGLVPNRLNLLDRIVSRSTPTMADDCDMLFVGLFGPGVVIAVKRSTGELVWTTKLDPNPMALITMSGTYFKRALYIGVSSIEEILPVDQCCTFIGSFVKLDPQTGTILWQTYTLPNNSNSTKEYSGAALWGSSPSIDIFRNSVYIATGNLYTAPQRIEDCQESENNQTVPTEPDKCIEPDNHSNSIMALDLDSGKIKWYRQLGGYDVWLLACNTPNTPNCPPGPNPDADFGEAPMMLTVWAKGKMRDIVVAVQKSGFTWDLDRDNGDLIWYTEAGPGSVGGGGIWGAATDNTRVYTNIANGEYTRVYTNIANGDRKNFTLTPTTKTATTGGWVAMDSGTGKILWTTADPSNATASGPVTIANGVLFAGSTNLTGPFYALDAKSGRILWSYNTGATVNGGASVSDGCVYFGHGYSRFPTFTAGTWLFAFCV